LHSDLAIQMNIRIIRVFAKVRKLLESHQEILQRLLELEKNDENQEKRIMLILDYLKSFEQMKQEAESMKKRKRIGFKIGENG
jgi:adenosine deaminase